MALPVMVTWDQASLGRHRVIGTTETCRSPWGDAGTICSSRRCLEKAYGRMTKGQGCASIPPVLLYFKANNSVDFMPALYILWSA